MRNRVTNFWQARSIGVRVGLIFMVLDMLAYLAQLAAIQAGIMPMRMSIAFAQTWVALHWPTHDILAPLVWPYLPSHGAGWPRVIAMTLYVLGCGLHAFIMGFVLGHVSRFLYRRLLAR